MNDKVNEGKDHAYGYCECGCGQKTNLAKMTSKKNGHIKGEPYKFLYNHHNRKGNHDLRFWSKVKIQEPQLCWEFVGASDKDNYKIFWNGEKYIRAHRFSYITQKGPIPAGLCVLHKCDNPACVNPDHLWLGTVADNNMDCANKGRNLNGLPATWERRRNLTHCKHGHPYSENLMPIHGGLYKDCRECNRQNSKKYRERQKQLKNKT